MARKKRSHRRRYPRLGSNCNAMGGNCYPNSPMQMGAEPDQGGGTGRTLLLIGGLAVIGWFFFLRNKEETPATPPRRRAASMDLGPVTVTNTTTGESTTVEA